MHTHASIPTVSQKMAEAHEVVEFGEPFYSRLSHPSLAPMSGAKHLIHSIQIPDSSCELGEGPIYRPEDDTLHFVDLLSAGVRQPGTSNDFRTGRLINPVP